MWFVVVNKWICGFWVFNDVCLCAERLQEADWLNRTHAHTEYQVLVIVNCDFMKCS